MARYVELFRDDYAEVLRCRPGMTDLASIKYLNEEAVLAGDPEHEYLTTVLPAKIAMAKDYCRRSSTALDIKIILRTLARLLRR